MTDDILRVEALTKTFGGVAAISEVTFEIKRGEILGIIGPNGAGKTTLINAITGVFQPDRGSIWFDGSTIVKYRLYRASRLGIGRTFQQPQTLLSLKCIENVKIAGLTRGLSHKQSEEKAEGILSVLGLAKFAWRPASDLNFAQRKLLDMARALATDPKLLFLDEVLTGLSDKEISSMVITLNNLKKSGITIAVVEHLVKIIRTISDRLVVMDAGRVLMEGQPDQVLSDPQVIESYMGPGEVEH